MKPHTTVRVVTITAALFFVSAAMTGCTVAGDPGETLEALPSPSATPAREAPPVTPTPFPTSTQIDPRKPEYEAAIGAWTEPLPPGYSWPAWDDLPHIGGQLDEMDNAQGVYRCILINAAWHAYFEDNDAAAAKAFAIRADRYLIADNPSSRPIASGGIIIDDNLAAMSGICDGISGPLG